METQAGMKINQLALERNTSHVTEWIHDILFSFFSLKKLQCKMHSFFVLEMSEIHLIGSHF